MRPPQPDSDAPESGDAAESAAAGPPSTLTRRDMLSAAVAGLGALGGIAAGAERLAAQASPAQRAARKPRRLKQSVSRWPYSKIPLPEFCRAAKRMGIAGIDLLQPEDWAVVRDCGLVCSMGYPTKRDDFIATGFNDRANHPMLLRELEATIPRAAREGVPNVIAMFGNRKGKSDAEGIENCVAGLKQIAPLAEQHGVTVCVELLNSKVDHQDYQGDHTDFGAAVIKGVGSPRVKLLYDIYHMQIMEGDVIRTVRAHLAEIAHFHTGGVPGRHEIDGTQELNYRAVATALADAGFGGFIAHEFVPTKDPLTSLRAAVAICNVGA
jgi:hydroxypyruvate isomerase